MKPLTAIVLVAGGESSPRRNKFTNAADAKPKCLYHVDGETILKRMTSTLRKAGVGHIRAVVGFRAEQIKEYKRRHNLGIELVYNREYITDAVNSVTVGLNGLDNDVLILLGDIIISQETITQFIDHESSLVWAVHKKRYCRAKYKPLRGKQVEIVKVAREKLGIFKDIQSHAENVMKKLHWREKRYFKGQGVWLYYGILETLYRNGPVGAVVLEHAIEDIDCLNQTDEGKV